MGPNVDATLHRRTLDLIIVSPLAQIPDHLMRGPWGLAVTATGILGSVPVVTWCVRFGGQETCSDLVGRPGLDPGTLGLKVLCSSG